MNNKLTSVHTKAGRDQENSVPDRPKDTQSAGVPANRERITINKRWRCSYSVHSEINDLGKYLQDKKQWNFQNYFKSTYSEHYRLLFEDKIAKEIGPIKRNGRTV